MIHNTKIFQNSLIENTGKAAFQASDLALKPSRPLLSVIKADQEVLYWLKEELGDFQNSPISPSSHLRSHKSSSTVVCKISCAEAQGTKCVSPNIKCNCCSLKVDLDVFRALHLALLKGVWPLVHHKNACWAPLHWLLQPFINQ